MSQRVMKCRRLGGWQHPLMLLLQCNAEKLHHACPSVISMLPSMPSISIGSAVQ